MELDPVHQGVLVDRSRVRGAVAQGLAVGLTASPDVRLRDRRERDKLDGVDLDHAEANPVAAALLDLRPLPEPDRQGDVAGQDVIAQLAAELHARTLAGDVRRRPAQYATSLTGPPRTPSPGWRTPPSSPRRGSSCRSAARARRRREAGGTAASRARHPLCAPGPDGPPPRAASRRARPGCWSRTLPPSARPDGHW